MNLRRFGLVGLLALALVAFALPATASAEPDPNGVFLDDHEVIPTEGSSSETTKTGNFTGPAGWRFAFIPTEGGHCQSIELGINFTSTEGHVHSFQGTNCTVTAGDPSKNHLPVDASMIGSWTVDPNYETDSIAISNLHINNKVTHPLTTHLVVSESTLKCPVVHASITDEDPTVTIESVELEGTDCTIQFGIPPSGSQLTVQFLGYLHQVTNENEEYTIGLGEEQSHE